MRLRILVRLRGLIGTPSDAQAGAEAIGESLGNEKSRDQPLFEQSHDHLILITRRDIMARGYGAAILCQGGFLLLFDLIWWLVLGTSS